MIFCHHSKARCFTCSNQKVNNNNNDDDDDDDDDDDNSSSNNVSKIILTGCVF